MLVGLSHHVAPVELRERVTLDLEAARRLARSLGDAVCLSTCNRTEVYVDGHDEETAEQDALGLGRARAGRRGALPAARRAAALHLFRVAAGLDSLVPGEGEILGQVRAAYEARRAGRTLDRVFRQALAASARPCAEDGDRREPGLGLVGGSGARRAGVRRARRERGPAGRRRAHRRARGAEPPSRGAEIALVANSTTPRRLEIRPRSWRSTSWSRRRTRRTSSSTPARSRSRRRAPRRQLLLVDIAVPRDLDRRWTSSTAASSTTSTTSKPWSAETLAGRRIEAELAERLVAVEAERFREWRASLDVVPAIASLRAHAEEIRAAELRKAEVRSSDGSTTASARPWSR